MHWISKVTLSLTTSIAMTLGLAGFTAASTASPGDAGGTQPQTFTAVGHALSPALRNMLPSTSRSGAAREAPPAMPVPGGVSAATSDGALQTTVNAALAPPTVGLNFDGVGSPDGVANTPCNCAPSDANLSVGSTQVVQWVNTDIAVFNKATGALTPGFPKPGNAVFANLTAGNCSANNDGDPIVKYDQQAGRWVLTQFSVTGGPPFFQCIAVSTSADATGTYNTYAFSFGNNFPDYPKLGVWPDAYYMSFNMFLRARKFVGADACAFDRLAMIAGAATATAVCFQQSSSVASLLPSDLDGASGALGSTLAPPAGSPDFYLNFGTNTLHLFKFHVNFATPSLSTFSAPTSLATAAFSEACAGGTCIPQLGTANQLDSLGDRLMYRLAYRNFSDHESLVVTHSVAGSGTAAPRWYELRTGALSNGTTCSAVGSGSFCINQQSSYAPDAAYRWMGSIAMDKVGDLAIGYSASSGSISPAIRFTGRVPTDPLNQLRPEGPILNGAGSQTGALHRWGDYTSMAVDPGDDCTFWYTDQYLKANGSFNWSTRIASLKFAGC